MGDSISPPPGCQPLEGTALHHSNQTTESTATGNNMDTGFQDMVNSTKEFDGSLYYRQSNLILNGKQRRETRFDEPQHSGCHDLRYPATSSSSSQVPIKVPSVIVSSELFTHKPVKTGQTVNCNIHKGENGSYLERLKRSFPSNGSHVTGSSSQEKLANKFMQRSRDALRKKEQSKDDIGGKKEHSPKSVSFANSVKGTDKPSKSSSPGKEEKKDHLKDSRLRDGHTQNGCVTPRQRAIQSNVVLSGRLGQSLLGSGLQNGEVRRSFDQKPRQQMATAERSSLRKGDTKYADSFEVPLPPSPPTRDTNKIPDRCNSQQNSSSVQVLSLYGEHSLFESNFSRNSASLSRQSNVSLEFSGSKTLQGSSLRSMRESYVQQTNSRIDLNPSHSLMSSGLSRDDSLTIEELLSSGSVKSSPENLPPSKFTRQFEKSSKREHSLDDYLDERGNLLQDLR